MHELPVDDAVPSTWKLDDAKWGKFQGYKGVRGRDLRLSARILLTQLPRSSATRLLHPAASHCQERGV